MDKKGKYPKNWIRELRTERGWTQRELAERAGFAHHQTINNLENSIAELKQSHITKIATAFGVHPLEVTDGPTQVMAKNEQEKDLLETFRNLDDSAKAMYLHGLRTFKDAAPAEKSNPLPEKEKKTS